MANENMDEWHSSVAVIDETVRAVIKFLSTVGSTDTNIAVSVSAFLGWPPARVKAALLRINAIQSYINKRGLVIEMLKSRKLIDDTANIALQLAD